MHRANGGTVLQILMFYCALCIYRWFLSIHQVEMPRIEFFSSYIAAPSNEFYILYSCSSKSSRFIKTVKMISKLADLFMISSSKFTEHWSDCLPNIFKCKIDCGKVQAILIHCLTSRYVKVSYSNGCPVIRTRVDRK